MPPCDTVTAVARRAGNRYAAWHESQDFFPDPMNATTTGFDPQPLMSLAGLFRRVQAGFPLAELVTRAMQHPDDAGLLMNLAQILQLTGNREGGLDMQQRALHRCALYHVAASQQPARLRLLVLMQPGDMMDNTPVDFLLEHSDVDMYWLYLQPHQPLPRQLPPHDVLFVAIGESTASKPWLEQLATQLSGWPRPVINDPRSIVQLARHQLHTLLGAIPTLYVPATHLLSRDALSAPATGHAPLPGTAFPCIIRPLDAHGGRGLAKIESAQQLADYLAGQAATHFYLASFVDYRSADGQHRKYRIALCNGRAYACHMAIAAEWMVHYKDAGMDTTPSKREEEAVFMQTFDSGFGMRHQDALQAIARRTGLDYVVMDCAETADGRLLVFELDNRAFVHAIDAPEMFPYRAPVMKRLFTSFRQLLDDAAARLPQAT